MPAKAPRTEVFCCFAEQGNNEEKPRGNCHAGQAAFSPHALLFKAVPHALQLSMCFLQLLDAETAQLSHLRLVLVYREVSRC